MKKIIELSHNIKLVWNEYDEMDGDPRGWFLVVDNENCMRPILKAIAPQRGKDTAIPMYSVYLDKEKVSAIKAALA